jgi:hypothetical protein
MHSDAVVVGVAVGAAACAMLLGLAFATWISGRGRGAVAVAGDAEAGLPPSVTAGRDPRELRVLAAELAADAHNAAAQAVRAQAALHAARATLVAAEAARAQAEVDYDRVRAAHADAVRVVPAPPTDPAGQARERQASRAALDAYRRGELPVDVLRTVFGQPDPDPERSVRQREADRLAWAESQARRAFEHTVAAARAAREHLHVAEIADAAVRRAAVDAAVEAEEAAFAVQARSRRRRR